MVGVELAGLVELLHSETDVGRPHIAPGFIIEKQWDARAMRGVGRQPDHAGSFHAAGPLQLLLFLQVADFRDPR